MSSFTYFAVAVLLAAAATLQNVSARNNVMDHSEDFAFDVSDDLEVEFEEKLLSNQTTAVVGQVFHLAVPQNVFTSEGKVFEAKRYGGKGLPSWLLFDKVAGEFWGIPLTEDVGTLRISLRISGRKSPLEELAINVISKSNRDLPKLMEKCNAKEDLTVLVLLISKNIHAIKPKQRIIAVNNLAKFFGIPYSAFSMEAQVEKDDITDGSVVLAGPGDFKSPTSAADNDVTILKVPVGCDGRLWMFTTSVVHQLKQQAKDGTISEVMRLPLIGWRVKTQKFKMRSKRQAVEDYGSGDNYDEYEYENYDNYNEEYDNEDDVKSSSPSSTSTTTTTTTTTTTAAPTTSSTMTSTHPHRHHHGEIKNTDDIDPAIVTGHDHRTSTAGDKDLSSTSTTSTSTETTTKISPNVLLPVEKEEYDYDYKNYDDEDDDDDTGDDNESSTIVPELPKVTEDKSVPVIIEDAETTVYVQSSTSSTTTMSTTTEEQTTPGTTVSSSTTTSTTEKPATLPEIEIITETSTSSTTTTTLASTTPEPTTVPVETETSTIASTTTSSTTVSPTSSVPILVETTELPETTEVETTPSTSSSTSSVASSTTEKATTSWDTTVKATTIREVTEPEYEEPKNLKPYIENRLQQMSVVAGKVFRYVIPHNTFKDLEDEYNLRLDVLDSNQQPLTKHSWCQFNPARREVYGLPLENDVSKWVYYVRATDSDGAFEMEKLIIHVQQHKLEYVVNNEFTLYIRIEKHQEFSHYVDWSLKVLRALGKIYNTNMSEITVRRINYTTDPVSFTWANDSIPTNYCPKNEIQELYKVLTANSQGDPSRELNLALSPELRVKKVVYREMGVCEPTQVPVTPPSNFSPILRNPVDQVNATVGELLIYKVKDDTFYDPEDVDPRSLNISLLTADRQPIPSTNWLQFDSKNREFYGIPRKAGRTEYQLVCVDSGGLPATDSLEVVVEVAPKRHYNVEFSMTIEVPLDTFINSAGMQRRFTEKLMDILNENNSSNIHFLPFKQKFGSTVIAWYNKSLPIEKCDHDQINYLESLMNNPNEKSIAGRVHKIMGPEFPVSTIKIHLLNNCKIQKILPPSVDKGAPPVVDSDSTPKSSSDEYLITFILPLVIITVMLLLALLAACVLYRRRRTGKMNVEEDSRQSYGNKGIPVIFQEELEEKPEPGNKAPIILQDEKPPLAPPEYSKSGSVKLADDSEPYQPPPPFTRPQDSNQRQSRPKATPTYRKPPPYVPP